MAQLFTDFIKENGDFYKYPTSFAEAAEDVFLQSITHTRRYGWEGLLSRRRPNESDPILEYRMQNGRNITKSGIDRGLSMISRIFSNSGFAISQTSEKLKDWLDSKPYRIRGQQATFMDYVFNCLLLYSIEDPNGLLVDIPKHPQGNGKSPASLSSLESVMVMPTIIPYSDIVIATEDFFGFYDGQKKMADNSSAPVFLVADKYKWYLYEPSEVRNKDGTLQYIATPYYTHATSVNGRAILPLNFLPGELSISHDGTTKYHESLFHRFFELADEFVNLYSDLQAIMVQHAHPKTVMREMQCPAQGCEDGQMIEIRNGARVNVGSCKTCSGTGMLKNPAPFDVLVVPDDRSLDTANSLSPPIQYLQAPTDTIKTHSELTWGMWEKSLKQLGLELLSSSAESGEAKKLRLQVQDDNLTRIGHVLFSFLERHLFFVECLLEPNPSKRVMPQITRPESYKVKDADLLREEVSKTLEPDRAESMLSLYRRKYIGNPGLIRMYELMYDFEPLLIHNRDELLSLKKEGIITQQEVLNILRTPSAFRAIYKEAQQSQFTDDVYIQKVKEIIESYRDTGGVEENQNNGLPLANDEEE